MSERQCARCAKDAFNRIKRVKVSEEMVAELRNGSRPVIVLRVEEEPDGDLLFVVTRADPFVTRNDATVLREIATDAKDVLGNTQLWLLNDLAARIEALLPPQ